MKTFEYNLKTNEQLDLKWVFPKFTDFEVLVNLNGENSAVKIRSALKLINDQTGRVNFTVNHFIKKSLFKASLDGSSIGNFSGLVNIHKGAAGTVTYLKEDALLISPDAKAESIPALEIDENDVKAGHSSAVAPLSENEIFYLTSRGIPAPKARALLIDAFFAPVLA